MFVVAGDPPQDSPGQLRKGANWRWMVGKREGIAGAGSLRPKGPQGPAEAEWDSWEGQRAPSSSAGVSGERCMFYFTATDYELFGDRPYVRERWGN